MIKNQYKPPKFKEQSFTCPHCEVLTTQTWSNDESFLESLFEYQYQIFLDYRKDIDYSRQDSIEGFFRHLHYMKPKFLGLNNRPYFLATCTNPDCDKFSFWVDEKMVYPLVPTSPTPHENMPENVKKTYEEARRVQPASVRASAALLRVSLEQLTAHLGETEGSLNTRIANLKEKGLPSQAIKSLDIVRIYANEGGAHAGVIDLESKDNEDILHRLFKLVNFIIEKTIADNKEIEELTAGLPEAKKAGIENRDSK